ncbi:hypothetical protein Bca52824_066256 [Brassica carinata]|uniref:Uncharacterized protein n=1 Tax=Brassica carinata TaxID=52824 RepID=A0A8X7UD71_BRACI|nr:hypothetical protein Bca52824_066256 [Brassica carinata]
MKRDVATEMEMEEEIEWRLKKMEGGRREEEMGLEMVKRREYREDEERKRKRERKKLQMHGLVTHGLKTPLVLRVATVDSLHLKPYAKASSSEFLLLPLRLAFRFVTMAAVFSYHSIYTDPIYNPYTLAISVLPSSSSDDSAPMMDSSTADVLPDTNAPAVETNPHLQDSENHPKSKEPTDVGHSRVPLVAENDPISKDSGDTSLAFPRPTFSLGLTQEDPQLSKTSAPDSEDYGDEHMTVDPPPTSNENDAPAPLYRKSKRPRVVPRSLVGDYQFDKRILVRAWEAHVNATRRVPNIDYAVKFAELSSKLESPFTIKLDGLSLTSKELSAIVDRSTHLPPNVMFEF